MGHVVQYPPVLLDVCFRVRLQGVDDVRELNPVADEEHRSVVSNKIEVSLSGVKLDGEATDVSHGFRAGTLVNDGGETDDDGSLNTRGSEEIGTSEV